MSADTEGLAQEMCLADDTMHHQDATDDFPCWHCVYSAYIILASSWLTARDAAVRAAAVEEALRKIEGTVDWLGSRITLNEGEASTQAAYDRELRAALLRAAHPTTEGEAWHPPGCQCRGIVGMGCALA